MNYRCFFFGHENSIIPSKDNPEIHVYGCRRCYTEFENETAKFKMTLNSTGRHWTRIDLPKQTVYVLSYGSWTVYGIIGVYNCKEEAERELEKKRDSSFDDGFDYWITEHKVF